MKKMTLSLAAFFFALLAFAGDKDTSNTMSADDKKKLESLTALYKTLDSAEKTMHYQTGSIALSNNVAHINLPPGFKFINGPQSQYILHSLWQNPTDPSILGMIVKDSFHVNNLDAG